MEGTAGTHLGDVLRGEGVDCVWLMGLALDYCVVTSALSAARQGFAVRVVLPATAAVDGGGEGACIAGAGGCGGQDCGERGRRGGGNGVLMVWPDPGGFWNSHPGYDPTQHGCADGCL